MNRGDRELLSRQMTRFQPATRREGVLIMAMVGVFLAGVGAGAWLFSIGSNAQPSMSSNDGKTALAFILKGTGKTAPSDGKTALAFLLNGTGKIAPQ